MAASPPSTGATERSPFIMISPPSSRSATTGEVLSRIQAHQVKMDRFAQMIESAYAELVREGESIKCFAQESGVIDADLPMPQMPCPAAPEPTPSMAGGLSVKGLLDMLLPTLSTLVSNAINAATVSLQQQVESLRGEVLKISSPAPVTIRPSAMAQPSTTGLPKQTPSYASAVNKPPAKAQDRKALIAASIKQPMTEEEVERFFTKRPLNGVMRAIIYVSGTGRRPFWQLRKFFTTAAVEQHWVQHMSFIGNNVLELVVLNDKKQTIVDRLAKWNVKVVPDFDPLSAACFTTPLSPAATAGNQPESEGERRLAAKEAFLRRVDASLAAIPQSRLGLRSFLQSLRKAIASGSASIDRFFNPDTVSKPTLVFDVTQTMAYAEQLRAANRLTTNQQVDQTSPASAPPNARVCGPSGLGAKRPPLHRREGTLEAAIEHVLTAQREDLAILEREPQHQPAALPSGSAQ